MRALRVCSEGARAIEDDEKIDETANKHKQSNKSLTNKLKTTISVKNFTKLLMAVVLLATYSCVQDATKDEVPVISAPGQGSGEVKALQVALPTPSRTELGDKDADGKYPVYWCAEEGKEDVLSVNGQQTTKIQLVNPDASGRSSVAIFDMPLQATIPYNIVYPYYADVEVNSESGMYPVKFLSEQVHTDGSFAPGCAPMYAWSDGFSEVQMHHLATVLRFAVKAPAGESVDLKYISVSTAEAEPIAGVFDVYCGSDDENDARTGEIKPREGATSTVFYAFEGDSYILSDQAKAFYIAVPKGEYSRFDVNFVAQDGSVCIRTFNASGTDGEGNSLALLGGKVREFPEVEFEANSKMMLIGSDADMLTFVEEVQAGSFNGENCKFSGGALLIANIDMTDKGLTTIEGFNSVFEGRNHTIKGLTQPLFGENTVATISNLSVEGAIVETAKGLVGMIARSLSVDGEKVGTIFNCSAAGSLVYSNADMAVTTDFSTINIGGVVGGVYGGSVSLSNSDVDITIENAGPSASTVAYRPCVGGIVGYACTGTKAPVVVDNKNNGAIVWNDGSNGTKLHPYIGGVAGYVVDGEFTDNNNAGPLSVEKVVSSLEWGGVIGAAKISVERCENRGSMAISLNVDRANIGGVVGIMEKGASATNKNSLVDCDNYGTLDFGDKFYIVTNCNIGGVAAQMAVGTYKISRCNNYGDVNYLGECKCQSISDYNGTGNGSLRLGGVIGLCCTEIASDCNNKYGANINVLGGVAGVTPRSSQAATASQSMSSVGGVFGSRCGKQVNFRCAAPVLTEKCSNAGTVRCAFKYYGGALIGASACIGLLDSDEVVDCHNAATGEFLHSVSTKMTGNDVDTTNRDDLYVAGLISCLYSDCLRIENCSNAGVLTYDNASASKLNVSGLLGFCFNYSDVKLFNCSNSGDITVGENVQCKTLYLGGIAAATNTYRSCLYDGCFNANDIVAKAVASTEVQMGGLFGISSNSNKKGAAPVGIYNSGSVVFEGNSPIVYLGGYSGKYYETNHDVQFSNTGSIRFEYDENATIENIYIGGFTGYADVRKAQDANGDSMFNVVNNGHIDISGYAKNVYASGCIGYVAAETGVTGFMNAGTIEIVQDDKASADDNYPDNIYFGGVFGYSKLPAGSTSTYVSAVRDCDNEGDIIYKGIARDGAYVGGVVGKASTSTLISCENRGTVVSSGQAGDWPSRIAEGSDKNRRYIPMLLGRASQPCHDLAIGGVVGETDYNVEGCSNDATLTHTCLPNQLKIDDWGYTASSRFDIGGVVGRVYTESTAQEQINLIALSNSKNAKITIYGSPEATTNSSSIDMSSGKVQSNDINDFDRANAVIGYRMNLGGVVGRIFDNIVKAGNAVNHVNMLVTNCTNEADINLPEATNAKNLNVAGVAGEILATRSTFSGAKNFGNITMDKVGFGSSQATTTMHPSYFTNMGGIVGLCFDMRFRKNGVDSPLTSVIGFENCENNGSMYYGEVGASFFQTAGGILGQALQFYGPMAWTGSGTAVHYRDLLLSFNNCVNNGNIQYYSEMVAVTYNYSYAGGILGNANNPCSSQAQYLGAADVVVRNCTNTGNIQFDRCNGYVSTNSSESYSAVGGIVGFYIGGHGVPSFDIYTRRARAEKKIENGGAYNLLIESCRNTGRVWTYSGNAGGIIGRGFWFVKITGTPDNPTVNEGDIVVDRNGGNVILRNNYGSKVIYAGGIAGCLTEYTTNTRYLCAYEDNDAADEGNPAFTLGTQYVRVEHAVNKGSVGATSSAGGIVGHFRSLKYATAAVDSSIAHMGGIEFCRNEGDIYSLEGATSNVGAIIGSERFFTMTKYTSTSTLIKQTAHAEAIADKLWPQGVANCEIGGTLLRGATRKLVPDTDSFQDCIYGGIWDESNTSNVKGKKYDGCTLYSTELPGTGEDGTDESVVKR